MGGRFPFIAMVNKYLENSGLGEATLVERERRLRRIHRDLQGLKDRGEIDTTNPEKMGEKEVGAFVKLLIGRGLKGKSFEHEITALNAVLEYAGNPAVKTYKKRHANLFRRQMKTTRLPSLARQDVDSIVAAANSAGDNDWTEMESYAIVMLALASGARHKELKLGLIDDLCLEAGNEHYHIAHPKGEATYGEPRDPPLRPECLPFLKRYKKQREKKYIDRSENDYLFPALKKKAAEPISSNSITKMVRFVGERAKVNNLDIHICRRTFGQLLLDEGAPIEVVSVLMGHSTTNMTERAYCRRRHEQAVRSVKAVWDKTPMAPEPPHHQTVNSPVIDKSRWDTGYIN